MKNPNDRFNEIFFKPICQLIIRKPTAARAADAIRANLLAANGS